jgi:predicted HTH domain antitoxin
MADLPRHALEAVAIASDYDGLLSHGRVGEILGLEPTETDTLPVRNNACLDYDGEDPAADVEAGRTLADR